MPDLFLRISAGFALLMSALLLASPSRAERNLDFNPSPSTSTAPTSSSTQASTQASTEELQTLQKLLRGVYQAETDGNPDEVSRSTETLRRYLIRLKQKGIALNINPASFVTTRDLTKELDRRAATKVADLKGFRKSAHVCFVAIGLLVGISDVYVNGCSAADANLTNVEAVEPEHAGGIGPVVH